MEAKKLKQNKSTISKGKIKKTIKNVICRPDPAMWPLINEDETTQIISLLNKHSVEKPEFKKLPWKELKSIPKDKRPKQPPIKKVSGFIFGMSECRQFLEKKDCSALLIDASVNPRTIVQPLISQCLQSNVPILCIQDLKNTCSNNFGIPTSCLGIQKCPVELIKKIQEIFSRKERPKDTVDIKDEIKDSDIEKCNKMELEAEENIPPFTYLYRTNKKSRIFIPSKNVNTTEFAGQQYIQFTKKTNDTDQVDRKKYIKMILKRISNNPNKRTLNSKI